MEGALEVIAILAIPVVWGLASARFVEWLRDKRRGSQRSGGQG